MKKITSNEAEIDLWTEVQMIRDRKQNKMLSQQTKRKFFKGKFKIPSIESILKIEKKQLSFSEQAGFLIKGAGTVSLIKGKKWAKAIGK